MIELYIPIAGTIIVGLLFGFVMMKIHEYVGPRRSNEEKRSTYESGMEPVSSIKDRHSVKFYLVAMLFILFDIEIVFMYPWAVQFRQLGVQGFVAMILFMVLLFAGFIYVVRKGALEWD
jgi:NADH-quinone oxidoreductase subunit A